MNTETINVTEQLEAMIDVYGLQHILTGLELVCSEKADPLRSNWQDGVTASHWNAAARKLAKLARETDI